MLLLLESSVLPDAAHTAHTAALVFGSNSRAAAEKLPASTTPMKTHIPRSFIYAVP
jgi:hypothetical protein